MYLKICMALLTVMCLLMASCATIFSGTSQSIQINSEPEGAAIWLDGFEVGVTPAAIEVEKPAMAKDKRITLKLEGYKDRNFVLKKSFDMVTLLNLFTGNIGFAVDLLTGALWEYSIAEYDITLKPSGETALLKELKRTENGDYIIPDSQGDLTVIDEESGYAVVFTN